VRAVLELIRSERRARLFFIAVTQSQIGTGAGYVALLLIAYDRFRSPWAISLILLADLVPAMLLGPVFGAIADRWSRRTCAVAADLVRLAAFVGIALVDGFMATVALALFAGVGTGLFTPAALAGLPSLVERQRLPVANSIYGVTADLGFTLGPAIAAAGLLITTPETVTLANGITFGLSALLLARIDFGAVEPRREIGAAPRFGLITEAKAGLSAVRGISGVQAVILTSSVTLFFGGLFNVGELPFVEQELGLGGSSYAVLVAVFGLGFVLGSLSGTTGGSPAKLRRRFVAGIAFAGGGALTAGLAPVLPMALFGFACSGFGNGMFLVHERFLIQEIVPDQFLARAFGIKDAMASWGFGVAFFAAGALATLLGARALLIMAGGGGLAVALFAVLVPGADWSSVQRSAPAREPAPQVGAPAP
jgi:MFS family permease